MTNPTGRAGGYGPVQFPPGSGQPHRLTYALIAVNVVLMVSMELMGGSSDTDVLVAFGAMFGPRIADGEYWRLLTAMFLHVGFLHLGFNMFGLWIFGRMVEQVYGPARFALIYVLAGLFGSVASYLLNPITIAAGASGALFGTVGALAAFFAYHGGIRGGIARQQLTGLLVLGAVNLVLGFLIPGIDSWAHLGGLVGGFILGYVLTPRYVLVLSHLGQPRGVFEQDGWLRRRYWVVPAAVLVLAGGIWIGNSTIPPNAVTSVRNAERLIDEGDLDGARTWVNEAIDQRLVPEQALGRVYYVRAQLRADSGDSRGAIQDLRRAVMLADEETRREAVALLARIARDG